MGIRIGNNNKFQGNINIGDRALQIAKDFNQEFNNIDKLLELLKNDLVKHYYAEDKEHVMKEYDILQSELNKPIEKQDKALVKSKVKYLNKAFSLIANTSSIASLLFTIGQII